eukprot:4853428-Amphidinium_carterae.1
MITGEFILLPTAAVNLYNTCLRRTNVSQTLVSAHSSVHAVLHILLGTARSVKIHFHHLWNLQNRIASIIGNMWEFSLDCDDPHARVASACTDMLWLKLRTQGCKDDEIVDVAPLWMHCVVQTVGV